VRSHALLPNGSQPKWKNVMLRLSLLAGTAALVLPQIASAQSSVPAAPPQERTTGTRQHEESQDIIVTAPFVRELDVLAGTSVLTGADLQRELRPQLGDT
jgi:iron complex outermembrane receptor protein